MCSRFVQIANGYRSAEHLRYEASPRERQDDIPIIVKMIRTSVPYGRQKPQSIRLF